DVVVTTHPHEQTLEAEYGEKRVKFRRPIGAMPSPESRLSTPQQETGYAEGASGGQNDEVRQHNEQLKQKLLDVMQRGGYQFNPADTNGNEMKIKSPWVLCYYNGTKPVPRNLQIKLAITRAGLGAGAGATGLYGDFSQNGQECEGGDIHLHGNRISFSDEGVVGGTGGSSRTLPGETSSLPDLLGSGMTILHLGYDVLILQSASGGIYGFASLME
ncbi:MAG: hypothetical protein ACRDAP_06400, partial [Shewanella sp.]